MIEVKQVESFHIRGGDFVVARREGEEAIGGNCTEWVSSDTTVTVRP